jgi:hypothetical protein
MARKNVGAGLDAPSPLAVAMAEEQAPQNQAIQEIVEEPSTLDASVDAAMPVADPVVDPVADEAAPSGLPTAPEAPAADVLEPPPIVDAPIKIVIPEAAPTRTFIEDAPPPPAPVFDPAKYAPPPVSKQISARTAAEMAAGRATLMRRMGVNLDR